jgi:hypothetical protein
VKIKQFCIAKTSTSTKQINPKERVSLEKFCGCTSQGELNQMNSYQYNETNVIQFIENQEPVHVSSIFAHP